IALLRVELAQIDVRRHVVRIDLQYARECSNGILHAVLRSCNEAQHVLWLGSFWREPGGDLRFSQRSRQIGLVKERDAEIQRSPRQPRMVFGPLAELPRALFVLVLFQLGDSYIV